MRQNHEVTPKVSVCIVTYNHERYIRDCLESLVTQAVDFPFEIIVSDDCSTDGTKDIVSEYVERYPATVRGIFHPKNIGPAPNYTFVHAQARGTYIAHIDGDDYALPGKLQAQADYLDTHPECNIVWHRMKLLGPDGTTIVDDRIDPRALPKDGFTRSQLVRFITIGMNSSKMYRASIREFELPGFPVVDYFINVEQIGAGVATFAGERPLGVYRVGIGVASAGSTTKKLLRDSFNYIMRKYPAHRKDVAFAALVLFIAAVKNRHWYNASLFMPIVARSANAFTLFEILSERKMIAMFQLPSAVRKAK